MEPSLPVKNRFSSNVVGRIITPKDVHIWIPRTHECVTSHSKEVVQMCWRLLRWKDYPGLSRRVQCIHIHKGAYKREARGSKSDLKMIPCWLWGWRKGRDRGGGVGGKVREAHSQEGTWPLKFGKGKERNSPLSPEGREPCWHLNVAQWDLQNCKITNLCCF